MSRTPTGKKRSPAKHIVTNSTPRTFSRNRRDITDVDGPELFRWPEHINPINLFDPANANMERLGPVRVSGHYYGKGRARASVNRKVKIYTGKAAKTYEKKCLTVIENPHSKMTYHPKIPDGSVGMSIGQQYHTTMQIAQKGSSMVIYMIPGLNAVLKVIQYDETGAPILEDSSDAFIENHGQLTTEYVMKQYGATTQADFIYTDSELAKWRLVSQGMRIRSMNTSDDNEGTWKAWRAPVRVTGVRMYWNQDLALSTPYSDGVTRHADANVNYVVPDVDAVIADPNSYQTPSMVSGRLKDLGRKYFRNNRGDPCTEFIDIHTSARTVRHSYLQNPESGRRIAYYDFALESGEVSTYEQPRELAHSFIDNRFDVVAVQVKGTKGKTLLKVDCVSNHEFVPSISGVLKPFETDGLARSSRLKPLLVKLLGQNKYACR